MGKYSMKKNLVVLSGAGVSAESGLKTFRGGDGLWESHRIEDVATPEAWRRDPELVNRFYNERRKQLLTVEPNDAHRILVELESEFNVYIITQNVDNLHERAGSSNILHLHGELTKVRSTSYTREVYSLTPDQYEVKIGDLCPLGFQLRPHIVWFGEEVPEIENAMVLTKKADVFLVIGTSLNVYPAAGLLQYIPPKAPIYLIDPNDVPSSYQRIQHIRKGASEGMKVFASTVISQ